MARRKKQKGYWENRKETFPTGSDATARAGALRNNEHVYNVHMDKVADQYQVTYSIPKWFAEDCKRAGVKI